MNDDLPKPIEPRWLAAELEHRLGSPPPSDGFPAASAENATEATARHLPDFDFAALLDRMSGYEDLLREMVGDYLENLAGYIRAVRIGAAAGDFDETARAAHTIKGVAANMNAERLRDLAATLEQAARAEDLQSVTRALPQLEDTYQRLRQAVAQQDWDGLEDGDRSSPYWGEPVGDPYREID